VIDSEKLVVVSRGAQTAMQGFRRAWGPLWTLGLVVVALASAAADGEQPCSVKALYPGLASARGAYPPAPDQQCCSAVKQADPACLCSEFVGTKLPDAFIRNVLAMPKACGRTQLSGTRCGGEAHCARKKNNLHV
jgi:hypothetical protein